jgi:hypothetical protein
MRMEFAGDVADPDQHVKEAALRPGPIRMRIQPMVLAADGNYRGWKNVSWVLACESPEEVYAVRDALRVFFEALGQAGPQTVSASLAAMAAAGAAGKQAVAR